MISVLLSVLFVYVQGVSKFLHDFKALVTGSPSIPGEGGEGTEGNAKI